MTMYQASRAKLYADPVAASAAKADAKAAEIAAALAANPQIGVLMRKGKPVYYVSGPVYRESRNVNDLVEA